MKLSAEIGVPVFGLDALSSAAYGPEAALTILIPLGLAGVHFIIPVSLVLITLLAIVFFSYRQTIVAYPGGGSYIVARANLGDQAGGRAAAALVIDHVLNVAVGISAGVGALVSAVPIAATWRRHEQSGRPLPVIEAATAATNGSGSNCGRSHRSCSRTRSNSASPS